MANSHTVHNNQPTRQRIYTSQQNIPTNLHAQSSLNLNINTFNFNFADLGETKSPGCVKTVTKLRSGKVNTIADNFERSCNDKGVGRL